MATELTRQYFANRRRELEAAVAAKDLVAAFDVIDRMDRDGCTKRHARALIAQMRAGIDTGIARKLTVRLQG